ncbi:MAG TPA: hypothetical protein VFF68_01650 [Anaerolineaceae bacterium]|nr:hypothetical protein [Anaerolineaceae bacterium]
MTDLAESRPETIDRRGGTLAREIGLTGVMFLAITGIGLFASGQLPFSTVLGIWPGVNLLAVVAIGAVVGLFFTFTYSAFGAAVRRPGADYVLASRTLNAPLAFAASWTFVIFLGLFAGMLVAWIAQTLIPVFVQTFAIISNNTNYLNLATSLASPQAVAMIGTTLFVAAFGLSNFRPRILLIVFQVGVLVALLGWIIQFLQLGLAVDGAFPAAWDRAMGAGGYAARVSLAESLGMVLNADTRQLLAAGSIAGVGMFFGAIYPALSSSEVKRPGKSLLWGSWAAIGVAWLVFSLAILFLQRLIPVEWLSAECYLALHLEEGQTMPWLTFYASVLQPSTFLLFLTGAIWFFSLVSLVQFCLFTASRIMLSWAEDGLAPSIFAYVQPGMRSPLVALFFATVLAMGGMVFAAGDGGSTPFLRFFVYLALPQVIPVLAAVLFPFVRPAWFRQASGVARWHIGPVPLMSLASLLTLVYLLWLVILLFIRPLPGMEVSQGFLTAPALVFCAGFCWYHIRRRNHRAQGHIWDERFRSLPDDRTEGTDA